MIPRVRWARGVLEHQTSQGPVGSPREMCGFMVIDCPRHSSCSSLVPSVCCMSVCAMSPFWSGLGKKKKNMFHVADTLKLEVSQLLWISIPWLCILKVALSQGWKNCGWPIYEGISVALLYCLVWVTIIEWSDTFIHNNIYFICELSVPAAVLW